MSSFKLIVIGCSAGGLNALSDFLPRLPANFSVPVVIVQHRAPGEQSYLAELLNDRCQLMLKEVADKELLHSGIIYLAPADYHVLVEPCDSLSLSVDNKVNNSRPAIDVLFESAADVYGADLLGVLLTGANSDGAAGIASISQCGGMTVVQDPATAEVETMPRAAIDTGLVDRIVPLTALYETINELMEGAHV